MTVIYSDKPVLYWIFMKKGDRYIPATNSYPEGFSKKETIEVLKELRAGKYDNRPAKAKYVVTQCQWVEVKEPK